MLKRILLPVLACFFSVAVFAQGSFEFKSESHDFGKVVEGEVPKYTFTFKNTGTAPIILNSVRPSCGCTSPEWTKEPVMPGEEGKIDVKYNSRGRIGVFNKSITITSNAAEGTKVIRIKGVVEKKDESVNYSEEELAKSPVFNIEQDDYMFGKIEKNSRVEHSFRITNSGKSNLEVKDVVSACKCVSFTVDKPEVKPGESAVLTMIYTPRMNGQTTEIVYVKTNDIKNGDKIVKLKADVKESLTQKNMLKNNTGTGF